MKVLVINWRDIKNPEAGGAEIHIDEILKRKPSDWQVDFVSATYPGCTATEEINGYRVIRIPNNFTFNFSFRRFWKKDLIHNKYDLVIDIISKIPLATPNYIKTTPLLAIHYHVHGKSMFKELFFPLAMYVYGMEKHFLKSYLKTPIATISESSKHDLLELYPYENLFLRYTGVHFKEISTATGEKSQIPTLIYLGRLKKYKRVDHLIRAFQLVLEKMDAQFLIGGSGTDSEHLKQLVKDLSLSDHIHFAGFLADETKASFLKSGHVYAIASEKEGWGISVIEANAAGLPAVAYEVEGLKDSIKNNETGILVPNGKTEDLADAILDLLRDDKKRERMSKRAKEWAESFSWEKTATDFYDFAEETVQSQLEKEVSA